MERVASGTANNIYFELSEPQKQAWLGKLVGFPDGLYYTKRSRFLPSDEMIMFSKIDTYEVVFGSM